MNGERRVCRAYYEDERTVCIEAQGDFRDSVPDVYRESWQGERKVRLDGRFLCGEDGCRIQLADAVSVKEIASAAYRIRWEEAVCPIDLTWFYQTDEFADSFTYEGMLGAEYSGWHTDFALWSPVAGKVILNLYKDGGEKGNLPPARMEMQKKDRGVWFLRVYGDLHGIYYTYSIINAWGERETADPYARAAGVNGNRSMVVDLKRTDPPGWEDDKSPAPCLDPVIWEVHVRDFSVDPSSGISEDKRGRYLAFTEEDTTVDGRGKTPSGLRHIRELGVTHVHLQPVFDFASVDEAASKNGGHSAYNWGYDPQNFNVPEGSYSTDPFDGSVRIREFKQMVAAMHRAGLSVVMDVVYNHVYDADNSCFQKCVPDYYFRKTGPDRKPSGRYSNGSGCGNETASERPMFRRYMLDSLAYWAKQYHIDGFRFDLMKLHDVETMNRIRARMDAIRPGILLYGEGWAGGAPGIPESEAAGKHNIARLTEIAMFNDAIRDAVAGRHEFDGSRGFVNGRGVTEMLVGGMEASVGDEGGQWGPRWADSSKKVVTYLASHDNLTLWDKLVGEADGKGENADFDTKDEDLISEYCMAAAVLLFSHGTLFLQAGQEFARTKRGQSNSYNLPDEINRLDWRRLEAYHEVAKYYKTLLAIRRAFHGFYTEYLRDGLSVSAETANLHYYEHADTGTHLAFTLTNSAAGEWRKLAVAMNAGRQPASLAVGEEKDRWVVIAEGRTAGFTELRRTQDLYIPVPPISAVVAVEASSYDDLLKNQK